MSELTAFFGRGRNLEIKSARNLGILISFLRSATERSLVPYTKLLGSKQAALHLCVLASTICNPVLPLFSPYWMRHDSHT